MGISQHTICVGTLPVKIRGLERQWRLSTQCDSYRVPKSDPAPTPLISLEDFLKKIHVPSFFHLGILVGGAGGFGTVLVGAGSNPITCRH